MSYIVLARKYRPQTFDDVIGQEAIAATLRNSIDLKRLHHAYLFTGPRGVGKTSLARIFSKALSCEKGPTTKPCNKCRSCEDINLSKSLDVIEIDGASNRGIDDVRAIRENIKFAPSNGKFKIYIIDEVHQITQDAFNALLKTLEEPPAHAKFIFATTSVQKVPTTILSRCQRFDFKRIETAVIAEALTEISKKEKFRIDEHAILEVAKAADGSLRDGQSLLDQVSIFSKGKIGLKEVSTALGLIKQEDFVVLFDAIADKDADGVLDAVAQVTETGKDPIYFLEKCLEHTRNLLIVHASNAFTKIIDGQESYRNLLAKQAGRYSKQDLFYIFGVLTQGAQNVRRMTVKHIAVEMTLLKCTLREPMISTQDTESLDLDSIKAPQVTITQSSQKSSDAPQKSTPASKEEISQASQTEQPVINNSNIDWDEIWPHFMKRIQSEKISVASYLNEATPQGQEGDVIIIGFPAEYAFNSEAVSNEENLAMIQKCMSDLLGQPMRVKFIVQTAVGSDGLTIEEEKPEEEKPIVKKAAGIFGGRVIKS